MITGSNRDLFFTGEKIEFTQRFLATKAGRHKVGRRMVSRKARKGAKPRMFLPRSREGTKLHELVSRKARKVAKPQK